MRKQSNRIRLTAVILFASIISVTSAHAVPVRSISIGDAYYINNYLSENDLVYVLSVDRSTGRVKVQYPNGAVDWVNASDLLTQSEAERADTGEAIGTMTIVGGALWAILDPEGFEEAMRESQPDSTPPQGSTELLPEVAISGVPFAPVVPGEWIDQGREWVEWAENRLAKDVDGSVDIGAVRIKHVPFYSVGGRSVILIECVQVGRIGAYYILAMKGGSEDIVLDGKGHLIHEFNRTLDFTIESAQIAESYLKFFTSAIAADEGVFLVLEPGMEGIDEQLLNEIGVDPIRVSSEANGDWQVDADVLYGSDVSTAIFRVYRDGMVDMVEDRHKRRVDFEYVVMMDGGRRMYVRSE